MFRTPLVSFLTYLRVTKSNSMLATGMSDTRMQVEFTYVYIWHACVSYLHVYSRPYTYNFEHNYTSNEIDYTPIGT